MSYKRGVSIVFIQDLEEGRIDVDGMVDAPIGVDPVFDNRRVIDEFGQSAQTEYTRSRS